MPEPLQKLYVVLPVRNRRDITLAFVRMLKEQTYRNFRLILVDDGSSDGTPEAVKHELPDAILLRGNGNLWWAGALNKAFRKLTQLRPSPKDYLLIINDDVEIPPDFLATGVQKVSSLTKALVGAVAHSNHPGEAPDAGVLFDETCFGFRGAREGEIPNCLSTRGLFLRVGDLKKIGWFRPFWIRHYFSDYEFTIRAHRKGYVLRTFPELSLKMVGEKSPMPDPVDPESFWKTLTNVFSYKYILQPVQSVSAVMFCCRYPYNFINLKLPIMEFIRVMYRALPETGKILVKVLIKPAIAYYREFKVCFALFDEAKNRKIPDLPVGQEANPRVVPANPSPSNQDQSTSTTV
jgi:glycosyltransferase involved in cell wall biosynthesis